MMRSLLRLAAVSLVAAVALPLFAGSAAAHPLGNFTVNHYTGLVVRADGVALDLVVDTAEIPAFQRRGELDTNHDHTVDAAERAAFALAECGREAARLNVSVDARSLAPAVTASAIDFPPGAAGLDTMRLTCSASAAATVSRSGSRIRLDVRSTDGRIGWREITAQGDGALVSQSSVPAESVSKRLTSYPNDLLQSPLKVTSATLTARPGGARLVAAPRAGVRTSPLTRGVDAATAAFTKFVGRRRLSPLVGLAAFLLAIVLGAIHALAPGHGKTVMAAFIVGERGSLRQAWVIGLTVTVTHTAGVLVLGIILTATDLAAPQRVYGVLGLASGLLLGSVGVVLLRRALQQRAAQRAKAVHEPHGHSHPREHHAHADHPHADHPHAEQGTAAHRHGLFSHSHAVPAADRPLGLRSIVAMGFAGGLVPSPSALVVLLGAVALGRTWFGVVLVIAYGAGMAVTLTGTGLLLSRASRRLGSDRAPLGARMQRAVTIARLLPLATAGVVLTVGVVIAAQGLSAAL
jgi:ABC-type nickel/cobalt efflux system permease component RcnA